MQNRPLKKILIYIVIAIFIGAGITHIVGGYKISVDTENVNSLTEPRNIMVTGFWNPTGQMIAQFSTSLYLNPEGWKGENWEDLGYNIYSFFPTPYTYNGTFEVDYQITWDDFWEITDEIKPIAIISFGAGAGPWEIEYNARNLDSWVPDYVPPYQPDPSPPDDTVLVGFVRHSTLPVQEIEDAINDQTDINAWVDWDGNPGAFLCEYMAYLGMWYQDIHNTSDDPYRCWKAGFIHVRANIDVEEAKEAVEITIREVIKSIPNFPPDAPTIDGPRKGDAGVEYPYTFQATDPEGDDVYYWILWGDGCPAVEWIGPYESGEIITVNHSFLREGEMTITARAKDSFENEGETGVLDVEMPRIRNYWGNPITDLFKNIIRLFPILKILI